MCKGKTFVCKTFEDSISFFKYISMKGQTWLLIQTFQGQGPLTNGLQI